MFVKTVCHAYNQEELDDISSGDAKFISQNELEDKLDRIV